MPIRIKGGLYNFLWNKGKDVEFVKYSNPAEDILPFLVFWLHSVFLAHIRREAVNCAFQ